MSPPEPRKGEARNGGEEKRAASWDPCLGRGGAPKLDGILKALHLDRFDKGDILLILVLVYLFLESDDEDWLVCWPCPAR